MKKLTYTIGIALLVILIIWIAYTRFIVKIPLSTKNVNAIEIHTPGVKSVYTEDKNKISQAIEYINSIKYYKGKKSDNNNTTPDAYIMVYAKDEKVIDRIEYFGYTAVHKSNSYGVLPFTFGGLEKLCNRLNEIKQ